LRGHGGAGRLKAREVSSELENVNADAIADLASTTLDGQGTLKAALLPPPRIKRNLRVLISGAVGLFT
jgi:hypothetical protein